MMMALSQNTCEVVTVSQQNVGDLEEEEDGEPLVVEVVAEAEVAVEVGEVGGGGAGAGGVRRS